MRVRRLIQAVKAYQAKNGLTDGQLAAGIGIHRTTWMYIKAGRTKRPGDLFLSGLAQISALKPAVIDYLTTPKSGRKSGGKAS